MNNGVRRGAKIIKVLMTSRERKLADRELKRRIKLLNMEMRVLVSRKKIAQGRLFAAKSEESKSGNESEEEWLRIMRAEEKKTNTTQTRTINCHHIIIASSSLSCCKFVL